MARVHYMTKISRARKTVSGMNAQDMIWIGDRFLGRMQDRIGAAKDVWDHDAPPLKPKYAEWKMRKWGGFPIRNLYLTGRTFRGMKLLRVDQNQGIIGFNDSVAEFRMLMNLKRHRQWGISPTDREFLHDLVRRRHVMKRETASKTKTGVAA